MGWCSATPIVFAVWEAVRPYIPEEKRVEIVKRVMTPFLNADWDCQDEFIAAYPEAQQAAREMWPHIYEDKV